MSLQLAINHTFEYLKVVGLAHRSMIRMWGYFRSEPVAVYYYDYTHSPEKKMPVIAIFGDFISAKEHYLAEGFLEQPLDPDIFLHPKKDIEIGIYPIESIEGFYYQLTGEDLPCL